MDLLGFLLTVALCIYIWNNIGSSNQSKMQEVAADVKKKIREKL
tara:strand:+ start:704 stop:835 length:132 start_codon:yes stop_codon:yes gene_type:complete